MNGLSTTLTVAAVGAGILAAASLWMGYVLERRVPPRVPRLTVADLVPPPADEDELAASIARHPSSRRKPEPIPAEELF